MSILALAELKIKGATIAASTTGLTTVVPAVPGRMLAVLQCVLSAEGPVRVKFQSSPSGTDMTGLLFLIQGSAFEMSFLNAAWFLTVRGEALVISLSANVPVGGVIAYIEVD